MGKKRKAPSNSSDKAYQKRSRPTSTDHGQLIISSTEHSEPRLDPTYGQRGAFPGLERIDQDDELFYGPANDGLEYLRMVRSEAKTVPNLLVAPSQVDYKDRSNQVNEHQTEWSQGYYNDGAYLTTSNPPPDSDLLEYSFDREDEDEQELQEAYYMSLSSRFWNFRLTLQSTPPARSPQSISDPATMASSLYDATNAKWRYLCLYTSPSMRVLAKMQHETLMRGLQSMETLLTKKNLLSVKEGRNLGAWCWGMLGRCREAGQLTSEDVGVLRMVGKKALTLSRMMRTHIANTGETTLTQCDDEFESENSDENETESNGLLDAVNEHSKMEKAIADNIQEAPKFDIPGHHGGNMPSIPNGSNKDYPSTVSADLSLPQAYGSQPEETNTTQSMSSPTQKLHLAKADLLNKLQSEPPSSTSEPQATGIGVECDDKCDKIMGAIATLDVIVTIVGEMYGQRDLLDEREAWGYHN